MVNLPDRKPININKVKNTNQIKRKHLINGICFYCLMIIVTHAGNRSKKDVNFRAGNVQEQEWADPNRNVANTNQASNNHTSHSNRTKKFAMMNACRHNDVNRACVTATANSQVTNQNTICLNEHLIWHYLHIAKRIRATVDWIVVWIGGRKSSLSKRV